MKKLLSMALAVIMVLALFPMIMASAAVLEIAQGFELDADGVTATNSNAWRSTTHAYEGDYSYRTIGKTGVWDVNGKNVTSSNLKNYVKIDLPAVNVTGNVGFYAFQTTQNTSKFTAWGVLFADGTKYFTKYSTSAFGKNVWADVNFVGRTVYKYGDNTAKTLAVEDFSGDNRVVALYAVTGGATNSGYELYIDNVYYETDVAKSSYTVTIDGVEVADVPFGELYTVQTPPAHYCYTDGTTYYYGGEEIELKKDLVLTSEVEKQEYVYTMDEGKQMVAAATGNIGTGKENAEYIDVDGDMKLALKVKSDQSGYFQLPADWSAKPYYKPISIKINLDKSFSGSLGFKQVDFCSAITSTKGPAGTIHNLFTSTGGIQYTPIAYTIDVTEELYGCTYFATKFYSSATWSESNPAYMYVDDVTITYEYDFDYVAPTVTTKVETLEGAQLRLGDRTGIRFVTDVDPEAIAGFVADGYEVEMGTLIAPADKVADELTFETETKVDVKFNSFKNDDYFNNTQIAGSLISIREKNYGRVFVGRGYIKLTKDGVTSVVYSETASTRSIKYLATACKNDSSFYETLDASVKVLVDAWASAADYGA